MRHAVEFVIEVKLDFTRLSMRVTGPAKVGRDKSRGLEPLR